MFSEETNLETNIILALIAVGHFVCLVIYGLYVFLKYLNLLLYYLIVDGVRSMLSGELLLRQPIAGTQILIFGASGVSKKLALKLARSDVNLIIFLDNDECVLAEAIEFLQQQGINRVRGHYVDFLNLHDITEKAEQICADYGNIDFIFNNFLFEQTAQSTQNSATILHNIINAFLPSLRNQNKGHIVTLTNSRGLFGVSPLKLSSEVHAIIGMMESLRFELKNTEIKTTTVCSSTGSLNSLWFLPPVDPDYLVNCTFEAVEIGQEHLMLPKSVKFLRLIQNVTPTRFSDHFFKDINDSSGRELSEIPNSRIKCDQ
ncbi:Epidermal retinol dehydrogenase 2 [Aphelenchoides bicaudatus]|nr:Epidermal retinol dehydrogenase 2 [Aphelenchoides bicaudatus]